MRIGIIEEMSLVEINRDTAFIIRGIRAKDPTSNTILIGCIQKNSFHILDFTILDI